MVLFQFDKTYSIPFPAESGVLYVNTSGNDFSAPILLNSNPALFNNSSEDAFQDKIKLIGGAPGYPAASFEYLAEIGELVFEDNFQPLSASGVDLSVSGSVLYNSLLFENSSSLADLNITASGQPAATSGIFGPGLEGGTSLGIRGSNTLNPPSQLFIEPTLPTATGIEAGRCVFLHNFSSDNFPQNDHSITFVPFADSSDNNAYGFRFGTYTSTEKGFRLNYNSFSNIWTQQTAGSYPRVNNDGFLQLKYNTTTDRTNVLTQWVGIDYKYVTVNSPNTSYILFNLYFLEYTSGQTINDFFTDAYFVCQGAFFVASSFTPDFSKPPRVVLTNSTDVPEAAFIDNFYLEKFDVNSNFMKQFGLPKLDFSLNSGFFVTSNVILNSNLADSVPNGSLENPHLSATTNYLNPTSKSYFNVSPGGFYGFTMSVGTSSLANRINFITPNTENITTGVLRFAMWHRQSEETKFFVLRTGDLTNNDFYQFSVFSQSATQLQVNIYKGSSLVATATVDPLNEDQYFFELRWRAVSSPVPQAELEILYGNVDKTGVTFDNPRNVYSKLSSILSYTDLSSPFTTAPEPIIIDRESNNRNGTDFETAAIAYLGVVKIND